MSGRDPSLRRVPQQARSRVRVERIVDAAAQVVVECGVDAVTTRSIAAAAGIPVASLYQYFSDKEEILLALLEREIVDMDTQIARDVAALSTISVHSVVEATVRAMVTAYHRRPALVVVFMRGRTNPAVRDFARRHNAQLSRDLFATAASYGMAVPDSTGRYAELAVEVADRLFQLAFESSLVADPLVVDEAVALVTGYLSAHTTPAGLDGVDARPPA